MNDQLIDIGVNLMHRSFDRDRDEVVARALAAGVSPLLLTGTSVRNSEGAARYADNFPGKLFATAGIHPHDTRNCTVIFAFIVIVVHLFPAERGTLLPVSGHKVRPRKFSVYFEEVFWQLFTVLSVNSMSSIFLGKGVCS